LRFIWPARLAKEEIMGTAFRLVVSAMFLSRAGYLGLAWLADRALTAHLDASIEPNSTTGG
jgi:hypothetical protein